MKIEEPVILRDSRLRWPPQRLQGVTLGLLSGESE